MTDLIARAFDRIGQHERDIIRLRQFIAVAEELGEADQPVTVNEIPEAEAHSDQGLEGHSTAVELVLPQTDSQANSGGRNEVGHEVTQHTKRSHPIDDETRASVEASGSAVESGAPLPDDLKKQLTKKEQVRLCHLEHPDWVAGEIALHLGLSKGSVGGHASLLGIKLPTLALREMKTKGAPKPDNLHQAGTKSRAKTSVVNGATETASKSKPTVRERVAAAHKQHPDWTAKQIAAHVEMSESQAHVAAKRLGIKFRAPKRETTNALTGRAELATHGPTKRPGSTRFRLRDRKTRLWLHNSLTLDPDGKLLMTDQKAYAWCDGEQRMFAVRRKLPDTVDFIEEVYGK